MGVDSWASPKSIPQGKNWDAEVEHQLGRSFALLALATPVYWQEWDVDSGGDKPHRPVVREVERAQEMGIRIAKLWFGAPPQEYSMQLRRLSTKEEHKDPCRVYDLEARELSEDVERWVNRSVEEMFGIGAVAAAITRIVESEGQSLYPSVLVTKVRNALRDDPKYMGLATSGDIVRAVNSLARRQESRVEWARSASSSTPYITLAPRA
jgi:hypothetical protein